MFIVKYDSAGNALAASSLTSGGEDGVGVATDVFGNAYVFSDYENDPPMIIGPDTLVNSYSIDYYEGPFLAKYGPISTTNNLQEITNAAAVKVYPNP